MSSRLVGWLVPLKLIFRSCVLIQFKIRVIIFVYGYLCFDTTSATKRSKAHYTSDGLCCGTRSYIFECYFYFLLSLLFQWFIGSADLNIHFFKPNRSLPVVSENLFSHPPLCAIIRNQTGGEGGLEKTVRKEWNRNSWLSDFIGLLHNEFIALRFGTGQYKLLWTAQFSHKAIQIFGRVFPSSFTVTFNGTPLSD